MRLQGLLSPGNRYLDELGLVDACVEGCLLEGLQILGKGLPWCLADAVKGPFSVKKFVFRRAKPVLLSFADQFI